uniref:uncharacterized protein LOC124054270 isoform X2 n=1 Tax=Scatophagus argus TaxID=75038 RepID=UPI001ED7E31D|nr:uncharacterized protein LOC124054270 isoform X2 [Scatophagus argus]
MEAADGFSNVSKTELLRGVVVEKLTAAAQEILAVVERTVACYEEEASGLRQEIDRQRRQLENLLQPRIKLETIDDQFPVCELAVEGAASLPQEEQQHKYESNDQFPVCEPAAGGGAELVEEEEQHKYEMRVEDSRSLGLMCYTEAQMEEEEDQEPLTEPDYQVFSRLLTPTVESDRRSSAGKPRVHALQDHIDLRIRVLEDSLIKVVSADMFKKYAMQEVKCPRGLQEADFLDLLRSTFPQLADRRPFDFFTADKTKRLQPVRVKPLTPEEIDRHISSTGHSALYIRLKDLSSETDAAVRRTQEALKSTELLPRSQTNVAAPASPPPAPDQTRLSSPRVKSDRRKPGRPRTSERQNHVDLRIRILEDSQLGVLSPNVFQMCPVLELQCPRGLQEADFLHLLRSTFPQLAARRPFDFFTIDRTKTLQPLRVETRTPEEIHRAAGHSALYIRLKPPEEIQTRDKGPLQKKDAATCSPSIDQTKLYKRVKSDRNSFSRTQTGEPQNLVDLRIFILEDSQIDVLSCSVYKKYAVQALQCPGGLREADFLDLLRSTFPQLAAGRPFDFFTTDKTKKLQPLRVKPLTPEEINRHIRSTGHSALYIRLKAQEEVQISEEELHRADADKYSSSTSDQTRLNTRVKSDRISFSRPQTGEPQNLVDLRIFILEDSQIDVLSCSVYKKYAVQALQCPGGLREADFLDLLRSTFPQLAAGRPFDFFTTDKTKKLQPLRVKPLTPEEINRHIRSTGHSALYIRLKAQEEVQISEEELHRADADKYSSFTSDQTRLNTRKMAELSEEIKEVICNTLPRISEETQWQIITKLQSSGLESREDLKHVQQEDLAGLLPAVQLRKLLNAFRSEVETLELDQVIPTSSPQSGASFESPSLSSGPAPHPSQLSNTALSPGRAGLGYPSSSLYAVPSQILNSWSETFQVPWPQMPQEILSAVADGRRPKPVERRQMVRVLVDEMRKFETNPSRSECLTVVRNIIRQYPKSFADITPNGSLLGRGYMSLLIQVKNRVDNVNRGSRGRRAFRSGSTFKRGQSDTYGCTRLQPELPPEETDETMEQSRQTLEEIYKQEGAGGAVRADVKDLMKLTFCLQRHHINVLPPPSVADLKSKWPFLFTQRYIFAHFESLTDISVLRSFEVAMEECGRAITEYFRWKPSNKDVMDVLSNRKDKEMALHIVQLLMAHFGENLSGLVLIIDESATAADVETTFTLPASPRLILLVTGRTGQVSIGRWMITLEGRVISEGITPTFLTGLAAVFAIYYIFNLHYQDEAARTLEFIQRRFIDINPERRTKAIRGKLVSKKAGVIVQKKSTAVNARVSTLLKNLTDFEWDCVQQPSPVQQLDITT